MKEEISVTKEEKSSVYQHEDAIMKSMMQFFADELLPYLGINENLLYWNFISIFRTIT